MVTVLLDVSVEEGGGDLSFSVADFHAGRGAGVGWTAALGRVFFPDAGGAFRLPTNMRRHKDEKISSM